MFRYYLTALLKRLIYVIFEAERFLSEMDPLRESTFKVIFPQKKDASGSFLNTAGRKSPFLVFILH